MKLILAALHFPYDLPEYNGNENAVDEDGNEIYSMLGGAIDGIGLGALEVGKDNREAIRLTIQQHFVGDEGYEIGTGITELCPLVTETNQSITYAFVVSKLGVNALDNPRIFNANYDVIFNNPTISVSTTSAPCGFRLNITKPTLSDTYKSWGLYALSSDGKSGRLIVGKNGTISNSVGGAEVYFNFLDNENLRRRTMIINLQNNGQCQILTPDHLYKGSAGVNTISIIGALSSSTAVSVAFILPSGVKTVYAPCNAYRRSKRRG